MRHMVFMLLAGDTVLVRSSKIQEEYKKMMGDDGR